MSALGLVSFEFKVCLNVREIPTQSKQIEFTNCNYIILKRKLRKRRDVVQ
jgi:hypothetical protein